MDSYVRTPWEMFRYILRWLSAAVISGWSQIGWGSATTRGGVKVHHPPVTYSQPCWFLLCFSLLWRREWSFRDKAWVVRHRAGVKWSFRGKKKKKTKRWVLIVFVLYRFFDLFYLFTCFGWIRVFCSVLYLCINDASYLYLWILCSIVEYCFFFRCLMWKIKKQAWSKHYGKKV